MHSVVSQKEIIIYVAAPLVFAGASLVGWARGCIEAEDLNRRLAQLQKGK